jgi:peroxiredoxin
MAQLRREYDKFLEKDVEIVVIGPENTLAFSAYWQKHNLPFIGLPNPKYTVLKMYGQEVNLFKFGRIPAQVIINKKGLVRFVHYGHDMSDISTNEELLEMLEEMNQAHALSLLQ